MIALGLLLDANKSANQRRFHGRAICADDISDAKRHVYRQITICRGVETPLQIGNFTDGAH